MLFNDVNKFFKKSTNIKSIALLMSVGLLTACGDKSGEQKTPEFHVQFSPQYQQLDLVNDLRLGDKFYPDVKVDTPNTRPVAVNDTDGATLADMDGFSTSAQFDITFNRKLDNKSIYDAGKNQNVFLVPLKKVPLKNNQQPDFDNTALKNFSFDNHKVIDQEKFNLQRFRANVVALDKESNVLRISPLKPLEPNTKYLIILLNSIKDEAGDKLSSAEDYLAAEKSSDMQDPLVQVVHRWHDLAVHVLAAMGDGIDKTDSNNIAYAYTFTTTRSPLDLVALASPKAALMDEGYSAEQADTKVATNPLPEIEVPQPRNVGLLRHNLGFMDLLGPFVTQVSHLVDTVEPSTLAYMLNLPEEDVKSKIDGVKAALSATGYIETIFNQGMGYPKVTFSQGYIELPYYLKAPETDANGAVTQASLNNFDHDEWVPSDDSKNVNTNIVLPYPAQPTMEKVPFLVTVPSSEKPANGWPVVIFQHGIFGDRSNSISSGISLASQCKTHRQGNDCFATIAMDLPLHGISPTIDAMGFKVPSPFIGFGMHSLRQQLEDKIANAKDDLVKESFEKQLAVTKDIEERHFNLTRDDNGKIVPMLWEKEGAPFGNSGATFMNFNNLISQRDRMRQAVSDLLNLNASLKNIDIDGDGQPDFDTSRVYFVGHSLGGVLGMPFVAVNNDANVQKFNPDLPRIQAAGLLTTGAAVPKLIENSPSFRPTIDKAFKGMHLSFGSTALEHYFYSMQNVIDGVDPINFAQLLKKTNTPLYMAEVVGGAPVLDADGYQKVSDEGSPQYASGDQTIPNSADNKPTAPYKGNIPAPLAGTEPIIHLLGLKGVSGKDGDNGQAFTVKADAAKSDGTVTPLRLVSRFNMGSHITPVIALENYKRLYADNLDMINYAMKNGLGMKDIKTIAPYRYLAKDSLERSAGLFIEMSGEVGDFFTKRDDDRQELTVKNPGYLSAIEPYKGDKPASQIQIHEHVTKLCDNTSACVIDNTDEAFAADGSSWTIKDDKSTALNDNYSFASNFADSATWWFKVKQAGTYNVSVRAPSDFPKASGWMSRHEATTGALYHVYSSAGESKNYLFNMVKDANNPAPFDYPTMPDGEYISLGTYVFNDPHQSYKVTLQNRSAEALLTGPLIADAIKVEFISNDSRMSKMHIDDNKRKYVLGSLKNELSEQRVFINHLAQDCNDAVLVQALKQVNATENALKNPDISIGEINAEKQNLAKLVADLKDNRALKQAVQQQIVEIETLAKKSGKNDYALPLAARAFAKLTGIANKAKQSLLTEDEMKQNQLEVNQIVEDFKQNLALQQDVITQEALIHQLAKKPVGGKYPAGADQKAIEQLDLIGKHAMENELTSNEIAADKQKVVQVVEGFKQSFNFDQCTKDAKACVTTNPDGNLMSFNDKGYFELPKGNHGELKSASYGQLGKDYRYYQDSNSQVGWTFEVATSGNYQININAPGAFWYSAGYGSPKARYELIQDGKTVLVHPALDLDLYNKAYALGKTILFKGRLEANHSYTVQISNAAKRYGISADTIKVTFQHQ